LVAVTGVRVLLAVEGVLVALEGVLPEGVLVAVEVALVAGVVGLAGPMVVFVATAATGRPGVEGTFREARADRAAGVGHEASATWGVLGGRTNCGFEGDGEEDEDEDEDEDVEDAVEDDRISSVFTCNSFWLLENTAFQPSSIFLTNLALPHGVITKAPSSSGGI